MKKYDVAAYVWPSYTGDEPRTRIFWPEGYGEWETVREAVARFEGHTWPRKPLWGYLNEADPYVMEMQIEAAVDHGVNVFIYDWYWYDNRPFLEQCLDNGFLKAKNRSKMKFYIMWANHTVNHIWDRRISDTKPDSVIWNGRVNGETFRTIGKRWMDMYFTQPEYYTIDNKPVVSIYDPTNFISGLGGIEKAREEMQWLDGEVKKMGYDGMHFQLVMYGKVREDLREFGGDVTQYEVHEFVKLLPFSSVTHYQTCSIVDVNRNYCEITEDIKKEWKRIDENYDIPFMPHVSLGWDDTPRFKSHTKYIVKNNTPEEVEKVFRDAKEYADSHGVSLITVNSWNEWTETSYLQPDDLYGYGYLDAVKNVFCKE